MKMTVTLSEKEVLEILSAFVQETTGRKVKTAKLEVGTEYEDRPGGGSYPVFQKAEVVIE